MNISREYDLELWHRWVKPYYLYLKNSWFRQLDNGTKPNFVYVIESALEILTESIVEDLLSYSNWRYRLVGSWFIGIKEWSQYIDKLASLLGGYYSQQGVCFALACFNCDRSINYLSHYLDTYIFKNQSKYDFWDNHHLILAIQALIYLNADLGHQYYQKIYLKNNYYSLKNTKTMINLKNKQTRFHQMIDFKNKWLK